MGTELLLSKLDKLHSTPLGLERIRLNLNLKTDNVVDWCRAKIEDPRSEICQKGKNWYITADTCVITVNINRYTIITAHTR